MAAFGAVQIELLRIRPPVLIEVRRPDDSGDQRTFRKNLVAKSSFTSCLSCDCPHWGIQPEDLLNAFAPQARFESQLGPQLRVCKHSSHHQAYPVAWLVDTATDHEADVVHNLGSFQRTTVDFGGDKLSDR